MPARRPHGPPCRECGAPTHRESKRGLCPACRWLFCCHCDRRLPEGRRQPRCIDCRREGSRREKERLGSRCADCGRARENESLRCRSCNRARYRLKRAALLKSGPRPCRACQAPMPVGRSSNYCRPCERQRIQQQPSRKLPCARCGAYARRPYYAYCRFCVRIVANQRRTSLAKGSLLAKPKRNRRWQEKEKS